MDHSEATHSMASERYLLDELPRDEMEAFEEHLFECQECAVDVRAGLLLLQRGKVELATPVAPAVRTPEESRKASGWFSWLRPGFVIPAMAILLLVVGYQNLFTYPSLRNELVENKTPSILPAAALVSSVSRGSSSSSLAVQAGQPFLLPLDIQSQSSFQNYRIEFHNPSGGVEWSLPVSGEAVKNTLPIKSPGIEKPGRYELVVMGLNAQGEKPKEVGRYPVELQFPGGKS